MRHEVMGYNDNQQKVRDPRWQAEVFSDNQTRARLETNAGRVGQKMPLCGK